MNFYMNKVEEIRKKSAINTYQLCKKINISRTTYYRWLNNQERCPTEKKIRLIAHFLNVSVVEISDLTPTKDLSDLNVKSASSSLSKLLTTKQNILPLTTNIIEEVKQIQGRFDKIALVCSTLLSSFNSIFYIKDTNLSYIIANNEFKKNLNLKNDFDISGMYDSDFFTALETERNNREDLNVLQTGIPLLDLEQNIPATRGKKTGLISKIPILDSEQKIMGILGIFVDITELNDANKAINYLKIILKNTDEAVWMINEKTNEILYMNDTWHTKYGMPVNHSNPLAWWEKNIHAENIDSLYCEQGKKKIDHSHDYRFIHPKTGKMFYLAVNIYYEKEVCFFILHDNTETYKRSALAELTTELIAKSDDPLYIRNNSTGEYIVYNKAYETLSGYPLSEMKNKKVLWLLKQLFRENPTDEKLIKENFNKKKSFRMNTQILTKDGIKKEIKISTTYKYVNGVWYSIVISTDIRKQKENEEYIKYLRAVKSNLDIPFWIAKGRISKPDFLHISSICFFKYGVKREDIIKDVDIFWRNNIHPDDYKKHMKKVLSNSNEIKSTYRFIHPTTKEVFCLKNIYIYNEQENITIGVLTDIS